MRRWLLLLSGLLVWAAHFFLAYIIGEFVGGEIAPIYVIAITITAIALNAVAWLALRRSEAATPFERSWQSIAYMSLLLSTLAIIWQSLPASLAA